ncbi:MAG: hypothetical protein AAGA28_18470 [Pseudomonadota bacterium]
MQTFPGGTISADGHVGVVHFGQGNLVAIELTTGHQLWRLTSRAWPVAASHRHLLLLSLDIRPKLDVLDIRTGTPVHAQNIPALPEWLVTLQTRPDALEFSVRDIAGGIAVSWQARRLETGGIVKSAHIDRPVETETGKFELSLTDQPDARADNPGRTSSERKAASEQPSDYTPLVDEISRRKVGDTHYVLRLQRPSHGYPSAILEALSGASGDSLWQTELGEIVADTRPGPLRK